ncbi:GntR family transcriptional regulator, partial [Aureimonas sp. Leaf324]|uniref:GntR family transcriptional regulator n=1 Tax=Aureimonas sp. Leaf324 TaxID=1736336 RepID=UPI001FCD1229
MFSQSMAAAIERSSRSDLPKLASALWRAHAAGSLDDAEAQSLAEAIEARKALPIAPATPRRRVGSRPRSPESMERRRRWAASGRLPPALAAFFTLAEVSVLAVIAMEVAKRGDCRLTIGHIAALAGVSASTVRNALREAAAQGLLTVEERRLSWTRNAPNVVRIVSLEWRTWLRLGSGGPGYKTVRPTGTKILPQAFKPFKEAGKGL